MVFESRLTLKCHGNYCICSSSQWICCVTLRVLSFMLKPEATQKLASSLHKMLDFLKSWWTLWPITWCCTRRSVLSADSPTWSVKGEEENSRSKAPPRNELPYNPSPTIPFIHLIRPVLTPENVFVVAVFAVYILQGTSCYMESYQVNVSHLKTERLTDGFFVSEDYASCISSSNWGNRTGSLSSCESVENYYRKSLALGAGSALLLALSALATIRLSQKTPPSNPQRYRGLTFFIQTSMVKKK